MMRATKNSKAYDLRNSDGGSGASTTVGGAQNPAVAGASGFNLMTIPIQVGKTQAGPKRRSF